MNIAEQIADTMPPPAAVTWDTWRAVTSYGIHWEDLGEVDRETIAAQFPDVSEAILSGQKWRKR